LNNKLNHNKLTLGFSPCPNDTFIFDALVHGKVDTEGLEFDYILSDVEDLNRKAFKGELQVSKLSFYAFLHLANNYYLLDSGAALGFGAGPLVISRRKINLEDIPKLKVAIPGEYTTANLLFSIAFPTARNKKEILFSAIEDAVLSGEVDAGVIIHEGRFTYADKELLKVIDLGEYWETLTNKPIPLGGIAVRHDVPVETVLKLNRSLRRSVEYAFKNTASNNEFIRYHARELSDEVIRKHINLYVNKFSVSLGEEGRQAITTMVDKAFTLGLIPFKNKNIFTSIS
jgi:1,4-dihydroxy-6-naphthoate synthase